MTIEKRQHPTLIATFLAAALPSLVDDTIALPKHCFEVDNVESMFAAIKAAWLEHNRPADLLALLQFKVNSTADLHDFRKRVVQVEYYVELHDSLKIQYLKNGLPPQVNLSLDAFLAVNESASMESVFAFLGKLTFDSTPVLATREKAACNICSKNHPTARCWKSKICRRCSLKGHIERYCKNPPKNE